VGPTRSSKKRAERAESPGPTRYRAVVLNSPAARFAGFVDFFGNHLGLTPQPLRLRLLRRLSEIDNWQLVMTSAALLS